MIKLRTVFFIFLMVFFASCNNRAKETIFQVSPDVVVDLQDLGVFEVRTICDDKKGFVYLACNNDGLIFRVNENNLLFEKFDLKSKYGRSKVISQIEVSNGKFFLYNEAERKFEVYDNEFNKVSNEIPSFSGRYSSSRFAVMDKNIYISSVSDNFCIVSLNLNDNKSYGFSELEIVHHDKIKNKIRNKRHLFICNNKLVTVSDNLGSISIYSLSGSKLKEISYAGNSIFEERHKLIKSSIENNSNSYSLLIHDAYLNNNCLYLLAITNDNFGVTYSNTIINIDLNDKNREIYVYKLDEGYYSTICVTNGFLWAYDRNGFLKRYIVRK